jgi:hypothetical protein
MIQHWVLIGEGRRVLRVTTRTARGRQGTTASPVLTVRDVCRRLRKSRRQVYRYMSAGRLTPCAQVLGQWLFATAEVDRCASAQVPSALRRFFWDVRLADLSVEQHRDFILGRLLEGGDPQALQWVFRHYTRASLVMFLKGRGAELLSRRAWQFWASQLGRDAIGRKQASWRSRGRAWGGLR